MIGFGVHFIAILIGLFLLASPVKAQTVHKIIDGDTFIAVLDSDTLTIRLCGIDAPESRRGKKARRDSGRTGKDLDIILEQGRLAKVFLCNLLPIGTKISIETDLRERDKYGRLLAYVRLPDTRMINYVLVESGMATTMTIPPNVKYAAYLRRGESVARQAGRGFWQQ